MNNDTLSSALKRAYFFLKFRPRTAKETTIYLKRVGSKKGWSIGIVEKVIAHLQSQNLINDQDFVKWFVEQRLKSKPRGSRLLKIELQRLGIEKEIIDEFFAGFTSDDHKSAINALRKKVIFLKDLSDQNVFQKAYAFLLRRGFSSTVAYNAVKTLQKDSQSG